MCSEEQQQALPLPITLALEEDGLGIQLWWQVPAVQVQAARGSPIRLWKSYYALM